MFKIFRHIHDFTSEKPRWNGSCLENPSTFARFSPRFWAYSLWVAIINTKLTGLQVNTTVAYLDQNLFNLFLYNLNIYLWCLLYKYLFTKQNQLKSWFTICRKNLSSIYHMFNSFFSSFTNNILHCKYLLSPYSILTSNESKWSKIMCNLKLPKNFHFNWIGITVKMLAW